MSSDSTFLPLPLPIPLPFSSPAPLSSRSYDPDTSHITSADYHLVYEPSDDTYLMMDTMFKERNYIKSTWGEKTNDMRQRRIIEIGPGSGTLIAYSSNLLKGIYKDNDGDIVKDNSSPSSPHFFFTAVDINPHACMITRETMKRNNVVGEVIQSDLLSAVCPDVLFDMVIFNPPYVPTPLEERESNNESTDFLRLSWDGGINGTETLEKFISKYCHQNQNQSDNQNQNTLNSSSALPSPPSPVTVNVIDYFSLSCLMYIVLLKENDPERIVRLFAQKGWIGECVNERKAGIEKLFIYRFRRNIQRKAEGENDNENKDKDNEECKEQSK